MIRNRHDIVAAAFAAAGPGAEFDPLRAQKLVFLIDRVGSQRIGGPFFDFRPYHYGPFDRAVYDVIRKLVAVGHAQTDTSGPYHRHLLTDAGYRHGLALLGSLPDPIADYFERAARWVVLVPYRRMLAAIYREYPEMAVNSVVRDLGGDRSDPNRRPFVRGMASAFDLMGTMHRPRGSHDNLGSDAEAIRSDWRAVGADIEEAMVRFGETEGLW